MSLINEALKRAKQAHAENLPPKAPVPPMRPVEPEQSAPRKGFGAVAPIGLAIVAVAGLLIFFLIWKRGGASGTSGAPAPLPVAAKTPAPEPAANPGETSKAAAANARFTPVTVVDEHSQTVPIGTEHPLPASSSGATNPTLAAVESGDSNHLAVTAAPSTPPPAPLKLQSIVFNPRRPSAMINGRIVFVGDRIRELRVMAIHRDDVLLVGGGSTNLLSLEP